LKLKISDGLVSLGAHLSHSCRRASLVLGLGMKTEIVIAVVLVIVTRSLAVNKKRFGDRDKTAPGKQEALSLYFKFTHTQAVRHVFRHVQMCSPDGRV